jgi:hypothetical protein
VPREDEPIPLLPRPKGLAEETDFRAWLRDTRGLTGRSQGDVVSRVRRAASWLDVLARVPDAEILFKLSQDPRFEARSSNVKSQLKRAVNYYRAFWRHTRDRE